MPELSAIQTLPITSLAAGYSPRQGGESVEHVHVLAASEAGLPPIVVHRATMRVIDGMHRLHAARVRGRQTIEVRFFDGTEEEAFVAAVHANVAHGLPLSRVDRETAAARIIASHPEWSDRWIAAITGLAPGTVAAIRRRGPEGLDATSRIGRDGRVRPLSSADGRRIASAMIAARPDASLREIAKLAGISPATVLDVRERMRHGDDPVPRKRRARQWRVPAAQASPARKRGRGKTRPGVARDRPALLADLRKDPSLRLTESGRVLLRLLDTYANGPGKLQDLVDAVPPHAAYLVADLARVCASEWLDVADQLESRLRAMP